MKAYLAMGGAMHDAAIAAWGVKGYHDYIRPISAIRYMSDQGQCTDPEDTDTYDVNGIGLHPPRAGSSFARYRLDGKYRRFDGSVAINDTAGGAAQSALLFQVIGDERVLWQSKPIRFWKIFERFDIDVRGVDELELRVICPGHMHNAHAVWLEPALAPSGP